MTKLLLRWLFFYMLRHQKLKKVLVIVARKIHLHSIFNTLNARIGASIIISNDKLTTVYKPEKLSSNAKEIFNHLIKKYHENIN